MYKCLSALVSRKHVSQDLVFVVLSFVGRRVVEAVAVHPRPSLSGTGPRSCATELHPCLTGSAVQALSRHHSQACVSFAPTFLRVVGALSNRHLVRHVLHLVRDLVEILLCEHFQLSSECKRNWSILTRAVFPRETSVTARWYVSSSSTLFAGNF